MDADVIVVGAGPTGLTLAHELALAGVDVALLDKGPGRTGESRALNLHPRTAEILAMRGMLDGAEEQARARLETTHFAHLPVPLALDGWNSRYPYQVAIPQAEVEQVLEEHLAGLGVRVRWNVEVTDIEQDAERIRVQAGGTWVEARYLAGCDGGRSFVRKQLGIAFPGLEARWFGTVSDVVLGVAGEGIATTWDTKGSPRMRPDGSFANIFPIGNESDRVHRIFYSVADQVIDDQRAKVPDTEVVAAIEEFYGSETEVKEVRWASRFSDASRLAEHYRAGRAFLAGDAAHIHLPLGGQGLNTGIQDAMNLGWKLAADVAGWAPEGLLDTYHGERHPVGAAVLTNTRAQVALGQKGVEHDALREIFTQLLALPEANRLLGGAISGLSIRYDLGGDEPVGSRLADMVLPDGRWAGDLFHQGHGVLLTALPDLVAEAAPWTGRVDAVAVRELPGLSAEAVLVRPDGHICWVPGTPLADALHRWFGAPRP
ncbi:FAD-dependent oxidoreductase [Streptomyces albidoflavus]|uniref:FAD-dependent oxidoreductase n=1 Tax=Streptomyces sampsonii TaxID=42239 RepID=A0A7G8Z070_9ACTN|nr:FAD-dependent oxidoreductase [Streptomyces sampsonii]